MTMKMPWLQGFARKLFRFMGVKVMIEHTCVLAESESNRSISNDLYKGMKTPNTCRNTQTHMQENSNKLFQGMGLFCQVIYW